MEKRRKYLSLDQCCKIVFRLDRLPFQGFFELTKRNRTRANHDYKLYVKSTMRNYYKYPFFVRIVNKWNELPKDVVYAASITLFQNRLKIMYTTE